MSILAKAQGGLSRRSLLVCTKTDSEQNWGVGSDWGPRELAFLLMVRRSTAMGHWGPQHKFRAEPTKSLLPLGTKFPALKNKVEPKIN